MKGKRYIDAAKQVNNSAYEVKDAISLACELAKAKFDETMELFENTRLRESMEKNLVRVDDLNDTSKIADDLARIARRDAE